MKRRIIISVLVILVATYLTAVNAVTIHFSKHLSEETQRVLMEG